MIVDHDLLSQVAPLSREHVSLTATSLVPARSGR
jgi:hypothetical protein